jgi:hypothetical protein
MYFFFFNLHSGGWSPNLVHSARRPLTGLLYLPRVIVRMENLVEWMAGETCPSATLSTTSPTWPDPGLNPRRRGGSSLCKIIISGLFCLFHKPCQRFNKMWYGRLTNLHFIIPILNKIKKNSAVILWITWNSLHPFQSCFIRFWYNLHIGA